MEIELLIKKCKDRKKELDLFIKECKGKNYDKYDIREKLKKYLKETTGINADFRVCGYKEILDYVYKKIFHNENNKWKVNEKGNLLIVYQTKVRNDSNKEYNASSFEDSFFHINSKFIIDNVDKFNSLKNKNKLSSFIETPYDFGKECIDKKTSFAIEILLNSDERYSNWKIPSYIEEGLKWLKN